MNWAVTVWGDHCFWLTGGDPARWPVLVWSRGRHLGDAWRRYDMGAALFLLSVIAGRDEELAGLAERQEGVPLWRPWRQLDLGAVSIGPAQR